MPQCHAQRHGNLAALINDMLDLAKLDAGMMKLDRKTLDLAKLAGEVVGLFQSIAEKEHIGLTLEAESAKLVSADENLVRRVISNLASNALKFTPDGGRIAVRIRELRKGRWPARWRIPGRDPSPGFGETLQQVPSGSAEEVRTQDRRDRPGLGHLQVVVESHGGRIWVESDEGRGPPSPSLCRAHSPVLGARGPESGRLSRGLGAGEELFYAGADLHQVRRLLKNRYLRTSPVPAGWAPTACLSG